MDEQSRYELKRALGYSIALHVAVFLILAVRAYLVPERQIDIESVIRVDIVGLPDQVKAKPMPLEEPEAPKPAEKKTELPKPEPKEAKPETPKVNLNKTKRDQESALKRLEALEKIKNSTKPEAKPDTGATKRRPQQQIKGNQVSSGSALKGIAKLNYQGYNDTVHAHVQRHWNLPQWMANANLTAIVLVHVDAQGFVVKKSILRSSGRPEFDDRVLKAIDASSPLPKPPSELVDILSVEGMQIEMTPD